MAVSTQSPEYWEYANRRSPTIGVRVSADLYDIIKEMAEAEEMTPATYVRQLVCDALSPSTGIPSEELAALSR